MTNPVPDYILKAFDEPKRRVPKDLPPPTKAIRPDSPAPQLKALAAKHPNQLLQNALAAWECRIKGQPVIDIAHGLGMTIEGAKALIREVHEAIRDDLKASMELNRELDLARIDKLIETFYGDATKGDPDSAQLILKCISQRSKLTGAEPERNGDTSGRAPANVLVWIQNQLPAINQLVDSLPVE